MRTKVKLIPSKRVVLNIAALLLSLTSWLAFVFVTAFFGWWMKPIAEPENSLEFFKEAVSQLQSENPTGNSALVIIEQGIVFDDFYSESVTNVDSNTVFNTASMSKWITAAGVMKLVQQGRLQLDEPVSKYLTRWQLPESNFDNSQVTVRRLLSHTAGFNDGLGFGDYLASEQLPTLEESLCNPRSSSEEDVQLGVSVEPGTEWIYSGGSYLILELIVEEVTGESFEEYMQEEIFDPLGMTRTSYSIITDFENNAGSIAMNGEPAPVYQYASSAATALATTSNDLIRFVMAQIPDISTSNVLSKETLESMREPHGRSFGADIWGLGTMLYAPATEGDFVFGHDGGNDPAINSIARINPITGDAIIILETGHPSLATEIGSQWVLWQTGTPDFLDIENVIASMILPLGSGSAGILLIAIWLGIRRKPDTKSD